MARKYESAPQVPNIQPVYEELRTYKLITPMLGGGADFKHPDSETGVRVSAIRGMLRFWWRALYTDASTMVARENVVWGGVHGDDVSASNVSIYLSEIREDAKNPWNRSDYKYALWLLEWPMTANWHDAVAKYNNERNLNVKPDYGYREDSMEDKIAYFLHRIINVPFHEVANKGNLFSQLTNVQANQVKVGDVIEFNDDQGVVKIGLVSKIVRDDADIHNRNRDTISTVNGVNVRRSQITFGRQFNLNRLAEYTFQLHIQINNEDVKKDVLSALWAWEHFGGLGARTRRGFGAVELQSRKWREVRQTKWSECEIERPPVNQNDFISYFVDGIAERQLGASQWQQTPNVNNDIAGTPTSNGIAGTPKLFGISATYTLNSALAAIGRTAVNNNTPVNILRSLVDRYKAFRQERFRNAAGHESASVWPDANSVRFVRGANFQKPRSPQILNNHSAHVARAQLGLPIMMQFGPGKYNGAGGRVSMEIKPSDGTRHASPLLFRPIRLANSQYTGMVLILGNTRVTDALKVGNDDIHAYGEINVTRPNGTPLADTNTSDILAGVLNWMKQ